jgi:hypothetical protein
MTKPGVMIINTSRGGLIDTPAVIEALKDGTVGHLGLDVYEEETDLFFEDLSGTVIQDDVFSRLLTFPNVIVTGHQAFFTRTPSSRSPTPPPPISTPSPTGCTPTPNWTSRRSEGPIEATVGSSFPGGAAHRHTVLAEVLNDG